MRELSIQINGKDYVVEYLIKRGVTDAIFNVFIKDEELIELTGIKEFDFQIRGYHLDTRIMDCIACVQNPTVADIGNQVCRAENL